MMQFVAYQPEAPLSRYIKSFWYVYGSRNHVLERIVPSGSINVMFNFEAPYKLHDPDEHRVRRWHKRSWIYGFHTEHVLIEATSPVTHMMGVRFKPGGAAPFLPFPGWEVRNQVVDLDSVWGRFARDLEEQLADAGSVESRFLLLERALQSRLSPVTSDWETIHAGARVLQAGTPTTVSTLSNRLGLSHNQLIRRFHEVIGGSPKELHRIARLQRALKQFDPAESSSLARVAVECGYYDQSHFNKDFKAFTGLTPTEYADLRETFYGGNLNSEETANHVPEG